MGAQTWAERFAAGNACPTQCAHEIVTRRVARNGAVHFETQCTDCGQAWGIKKSTLTSEQIAAAPPRDESLKKAHKEAAAPRRRARYLAYLASPEWQERRAPVLKRSQGVCEWCGAAEPLQVHHLHYDSIGEESPDDLAALCRACHMEAHEIGHE